MSSAHGFLTRKVLDALPPWQQELWAPQRDRLIAEFPAAHTQTQVNCPILVSQGG